MKKLVVIGDPINHSLSPLIHNAALKALELDKDFYYEKQRMNHEELADFIQSMRDGEIVGANVTLPHKETVMKYLDGVTQEAKLIGAVNTLYSERGKIIGDNTDGIGFLTSLEENEINVTHKKITILGAGGAARAAAITLAHYNTRKLVILNRSVKKAKILSRDIEEKIGKKVRVKSLKKIEEETKDAEILINCTSVGMKNKQENKTLVVSKMLNSHTTVIDIIYNPLKTKLLREAEIAGCKTINGTGMLIHQAAAAFKMWTGKNPPLKTMKNTLLTHLEGAQ